MKQKSAKVEKILGLTEDDFFKFYKKTKFTSFPEKVQRSIPNSWIKIYYKTYPRFPSVKLDPPQKLVKSIGYALKSRKSAREFKGEITKTELSTILLLSGGTLEKATKETNEHRYYPSAGARYPLEIYLYVNKCGVIEKGLYHFNIKDNSLEVIEKGNFSSKILEITGEKWVNNSSTVIFISAVFRRTTVKYGLRGYLFPFIEAGHLCQNVYLISATLGLKCCAIGGFIDGAANELFDLDPRKESVIYIVAIGK